MTDGGLAAGDVSCTITLSVTARPPAGTSVTYANCPGNLTVAGLNPPACARVTFQGPPPSPPARSRPRVTTRTSAARLQPGGRLHDVVRIHGLEPGHGAVGTAQLFGPFGSRERLTCNPRRLAATVSFTPRNGRQHTRSIRLSRPGYYTWLASTSADSPNLPARHRCGMARETTLVAKPAYRAPIVDGGFSGTVRSRDAAPTRPLAVLRIPAIGVKAPVKAVGISAGVMDLPDDTSRVGWLRRSAGYRDRIGTTVVAGHVSDRFDRPGALSRLRDTRPGQIVSVRHRGRTARYRIIRTETFARDHRLPQRLFSTTGAHRLVLITCTGRITTLDGRFHYSRYLVVTARPVR